MKNTFKIILVLSMILVGITFSSCDFLNVDSYFMDTMKEDSIFHTKKNADGFLWNTPSLFPDPGAIWGSSYCPGELASDELVARWKSSEFAGLLFTVGEISSENLYSMNIWGNMYKVINRCNEMLVKVNTVPNMTSMEVSQYKAYVHFMRGWAYYLLLQNWGPLLIVGDDIIKSNEPAEYYNKERATYDESVNYVCNEFELAAKYMPNPESIPLSMYGRPTKGTAFALIARLRLQQASPLYNGGTAARQYFGAWTRKSDGVHYVSQEYDPTKWAVAAASCKRVIDMGYYELHIVPANKLTPALPSNVPSELYPNGAGGIDHFHSYKDMFDGETLPQFNKEFIWAEPVSSNVSNYITHSFARTDGGWGGMSVPQRVVDAYYMVDGSEISHPGAEYPYEPDPLVFNQIAKSFSGYELKTSNVPEMYDNREMRFYASIGFSGCFWTMNSATKTGQNNKQVFYGADQPGGKDGAGNNPNDYTCTGYVPVKYIHPDDAKKDDDKNGRVMAKPFPTIRYAEILLSYVEALNNTEGNITISFPDNYGDLHDITLTRDENEMKKYFNLIRYRAGLPGLTSTQLADKNIMNNVLMKERQIEFFNENQRFYDVRRWGIYTATDKEYWTGMNVEGKFSDKTFYQIVPVNIQVIRDRIAEHKMVWLPINHDELLKVPKMDQNPGWDR